MKNFIIGFCGAQKAGKSTAANMFKDFWAPRIQVLHFASPILDTIKTVFEIDITDYETQKSTEYNIGGYVFSLRTFMQKIGDAYRKEFGGDFFVRMLNRKICKDIILIDDLRYPEEEAFVRHNQGLIVRVNRPSVKSSQEGASHASEQYWSKFKADVVLENTGSIKDLHAQILDTVLPQIPKMSFVQGYPGYKQSMVQGIPIDIPLN